MLMSAPTGLPRCCRQVSPASREMPDQAGVPRDRDARPSPDHVLALRADRVTTMRQVLAGRTEPVPDTRSRRASQCGAAFRPCPSEEWQHRHYDERERRRDQVPPVPPSRLSVGSCFRPNRYDSPRMSRIDPRPRELTVIRPIRFDTLAPCLLRLIQLPLPSLIRRSNRNPTIGLPRPCRHCRQPVHSHSHCPGNHSHCPGNPGLNAPQPTRLAGRSDRDGADDLRVGRTPGPRPSGSASRSARTGNKRLRKSGLGARQVSVQRPASPVSPHAPRASARCSR